MVVIVGDALWLAALYDPRTFCPFTVTASANAFISHSVVADPTPASARYPGDPIGSACAVWAGNPLTRPVSTITLSRAAGNLNRPVFLLLRHTPNTCFPSSRPLLGIITPSVDLWGKRRKWSRSELNAM
ncbi:hypothetical protein ACFQYP_32395 [Nonomuraea antimicrobica]